MTTTPRRAPPSASTARSPIALSSSAKDTKLGGAPRTPSRPKQHLAPTRSTPGRARHAVVMRLNRLALIPFSVLWVLLAGTVEAQTTVPFTTPGTTSWTAPAGVTSATVQAWGGGGAGGGATGNPAEGGGGAGGQYAIKVIAVTPGNSYAVVVGAGGTSSTGDGGAGGDSTFNGTSVVAKGGAGGAGAAEKSQWRRRWFRFYDGRRRHDCLCGRQRILGRRDQRRLPSRRGRRRWGRVAAGRAAMHRETRGDPAPQTAAARVATPATVLLTGIRAVSMEALAAGLAPSPKPTEAVVRVRRAR